MRKAAPTYEWQKNCSHRFPGSGKSTFAAALHAITNIPVYHLDLFFWNPDRTEIPKSVFHQKVAEVMATDEWILDGNYPNSIEKRVQHCDTVILMDYDPEVCLSGVRERMGKPRVGNCWTETEEDPAFMDRIRHYRANSLPDILAILERYPEKDIQIFHTREEADAWLWKIEKEQG